MTNLTVVYARESLPASGPSVFLAGPTPRAGGDVPSWRPAAIEELAARWTGEQSLTVLTPESRGGIRAKHYDDQVGWETEARASADAILFWIPRDLETLPGFTTNVEFGLDIATGKVVLGCPSNCPNPERNRYLIWVAEQHGAPVRDKLADTVDAALDIVTTRQADRQIAYTPSDITPPELLPAALAEHVPTWAEAAPTPTDVHDWPQRQADALVPFRLDQRGWPVNPAGRTGRCGRNLGKWGENAAADPIVVAGTGDHRRVLLITRDDIGVEAIPGGMVDPGETAPAALVRELREETGVDLTGHRPVILGRDLVDDWRNSDHAWVASTSALYLLPATVTAVAADDALDASWYPFGSLDLLDAAITAAGRRLYAAHRPLLQRALDHLAADRGDTSRTAAARDANIPDRATDGQHK
ncbi:NUDIX domain-containing protein [Streptomyces albidoflavus]